MKFSIRTCLRTITLVTIISGYSTGEAQFSKDDEALKAISLESQLLVSDVDQTPTPAPAPPLNSGPFPVPPPVPASGIFSFAVAEGGFFHVNGTQTVRYGLHPKWVQKTVSGRVECSSDFFGIDPLEGAQKQCEVFLLPKWRFLADQEDAFTVNLMQTVRYGTQSRWLKRVLTGTHVCTDETFGADPATGLKKRCELSYNPRWMFMAPESSSFTVTGTKRVRFGTRALWVEKVFSDTTVDCSASFFDLDPGSAAPQQCQMEVVPTSPPPPPIPAPSPSPVPIPAGIP